MFEKFVKENTLPYKIFILFISTSAILIAQSVYNILSLDSVDESIVLVHRSTIELEELSRKISMPMSNIRMLSMELVLAPDKKMMLSINKKIESKIDDMDRSITVWEKKIHATSTTENTLGLNEFSHIKLAWIDYKNALEKTRYYVSQSIRVASFISVTQQEKISYENLLHKLSAFNKTQVNSSNNIYSMAQENSAFTYWTLVLTTIVEVLILKVIMFVVLRLVLDYVRSKQKYEKELAAATAKAKAANRSKSEFLANMSHELRTPLSTILGYSQLMRRNPSITESQRENLETINRSGEHLLGLINDVLDMSKIEAGRITLDKNNFDLYQTLLMIEEMIQVRAEGKKLQFIMEKTPDLPQFINTDEQKLRQTLINLLGNAVKFTDEGGVVLRVKEDGERGKGEDETSSTCTLLFEIEDSGAGILPEDMENLFQPFIQTASGRKIKEGTGLGLAISQKMVQLMGGEISAVSQIDKGSLFKFHIQVKLVEREEIEIAKIDRRVLELQPDQAACRVLVVEDIEENRRLLCMLLETAGFEVREACNGKEGVEQYKIWKPHIILMDIRMPVMDGREATRQIREIEQEETQGHTVIIAVTASSFESEREQVRSVGCDDFIRKPFRDHEIFECIAEYLGVRYLYTEETPKHQEPGTAKKFVLNAADLEKLPSELIDKLHQAAMGGQSEELLELADKIAPLNAQLAEVLKKLVHEYRYDKLEELLHSASDL